ncbi:MAG TPA: hypothetical protein VFG76_03445, partial [Candidatus Polarisedimenticolia bacterium]|nr:hypothetical protein [Candidatus Polarisedimenticolia bacterium]
QARALLTAVSKGSAPADLTGWAILRLGWDLEREGKREEAVALYRRAAGLKRFTFRAAAHEMIDHPPSAPPEG